MRTSAIGRRSLWFALAGLTVVLGGLVLGPVSNAGAATHPPVAGTYEVFITGYSPFSLVLLKDRAVEGGGSWSISHHVVTADVTGNPAPTVICLNFHQPPFCNYTDVYVGPKTSTGIAGTVTAYVGTATQAVSSSPFYAVRTGRP
jgi:hypothetical protein